MAIKTAKELAAACKDVAKNYKTLYIMGCFGAPMTAKNKARYTKNHSYNKQAFRAKEINEASADTFGFDCVCLIKGLLWGWNGDTSNTYGGASYLSCDVPDIGADSMIKRCKDVSFDFSNIQVGEAVWMPGHIGVYVGDGLAVECTPIWKDGVQITAVANIGRKEGYNAREWEKHGKLPYVTYEEEKPAADPADVPSVKATDGAKSFLKTLAGTYKVTAKAGLNVRHGAGTTKKKMVAIPYGTRVKCYGYYSTSLGVKWLYIQFTYQGTQYTGFASGKYLAK
jgi:hypothetical protein